MAGGPGAATYADSLMNEAADALEVLGFVVTDRAPAGALDRALGPRPLATPARLTLPPARSRELNEDLPLLASAGKVRGKDAMAVLGKWTWGALLQRESVVWPCREELA